MGSVPGFETCFFGGAKYTTWSEEWEWAGVKRMSFAAIVTVYHEIPFMRIERRAFQESCPPEEGGDRSILQRAQPIRETPERCHRIKNDSILATNVAALAMAG